MNSKVLITLCFVALFSAQGISARRVDVQEVRGPLDDLIKKANDLIGNLKTTVEGTVQEKLNDLENTANSIIGVKDKILDQGKQIIGDKINGDIVQINNAEAEADKKGVTVKECVFGKVQEIKDVGIEGFSNLVACVTARVDEALDVVNKAIGIVTGAYDKIIVIPGKVKSCATSFTALVCLPKIIYDVSALAVSIPAQVATTTTAAISFYNTLVPKLTLCSTTEVAKVTAKAALVTTSTLTCITNKISSK